MEPFERQLLEQAYMQQPETLSVIVRSLIFGPSFEQSMIQEVRLRIICNHEDEGILHGYLACMGALAVHGGFFPNSCHQSTVRRGALAVSKLRTRPPAMIGELENWVTAGLMVITFAMTALGTGATQVRRHVLRHVAAAPNIPKGLVDLDSLLCMAVLETWECLIKRSVPVYRLDRSSSEHVDRLFGITGGLLGHFYDICNLSHALKDANEGCRT
jgi:hypothetical protein